MVFSHPNESLMTPKQDAFEIKRVTVFEHLLRARYFMVTSEPQTYIKYSDLHFTYKKTKAQRLNYIGSL